MSVLGIILARKNSKRLPGKNTKLLNGKALIEYTIDAALNSGVIDTLIVSTDDKIVWQIANTCKIKDDFKNFDNILVIHRPPYLATDNAPSEECVLHAMGHVEEHDYVMLLQPTSPLRTAQDIYNCVTFKVDVSVTEETYKLNGAIYLTKWDRFYKERKFIYDDKYVMPKERSIDIDTKEDFLKAEMLIKERI